MKFNIQFYESNQIIDVTFQANTRPFDIKFEHFQKVTIEATEYYKGEYKITPKTESQTLATAQKKMSDNLVVKAIPYYEVSNTAGGTTVTIGKELTV